MPSSLTNQNHKSPVQNLALIVDGPGGAQYNMDRDVALFEQGEPAIRFYTWEERSFSIGYFQSFDEVRQELLPSDQQCPMVKRITGGGVVEHGADLTFSIILPHPEEWGMGSTRESYFKINLLIQETLGCIPFSPLPSRERCGESSESSIVKGKSVSILFDQEFKPTLHERKNYFCFKKPTIYDLMVNGVKIGGGAQRRRDGKLLHQGSLRVSMDAKTRRQFILSFYNTLNTCVSYS
jgi:lipoate-protein ligase A